MRISPKTTLAALAACLLLTAALAAPALADTVTLEAGQRHTWRVDQEHNVNCAIKALEASSGGLFVGRPGDSPDVSLESVGLWNLDQGQTQEGIISKPKYVRVGVTTGKVTVTMERR